MGGSARGKVVAERQRCLLTSEPNTAGANTLCSESAGRNRLKIKFKSDEAEDVRKLIELKASRISLQSNPTSDFNLQPLIKKTSQTSRWLW